MVAGEVRSLADKTRSTIQETQAVIRNMVANVTSVEATSVNLVAGVQEINDTVLGFQNNVTELQTQVNVVFGEVRWMASDVFMSLAKLDHVIWKVNTYLSISKREPVFPFVDHHHCRLGKWYEQGEGKEFFGHSKHYQELNAPHSRVHDSTRRIFELLAQDPVDDQALFAIVNEMEQSSHQVFKALDRIDESVQGTH